MPRKVFVAGEILTAADVNTNLMDQAVMVFDDATDRATAIPTPVEGMVTYLEDVGGAQGLEVFDGSVFTPVAIEPDPPAILQVVSTAKTNIFSTASTSFTPITDLSATITPTATTSKILVIAHLAGSTSDDGGTTAQSRQMRDATVIHVGDAVSGGTSASGSFSGRVHNDGVAFTASWAVLDEPGSTSAVVYSVQLRTSAGTSFLNRSRAIGFPATTTAPSSITLMEVAG